MKLSRAYIPAIGWTLLIASSSLLPASTFKKFTFNSFFEIDKLIHFILYFVFVLLWSLIAEKAMSSLQKFWLAVVSIAFGVAIELLQSAMALGRSYEINDIMANSVGCFIGILMIPFVRRKMLYLKKHLPFFNNLYYRVKI